MLAVPVTPLATPPPTRALLLAPQPKCDGSPLLLLIGNRHVFLPPLVWFCGSPLPLPALLAKRGVSTEVADSMSSFTEVLLSSNVEQPLLHWSNIWIRCMMLWDSAFEDCSFSSTLESAFVFRSVWSRSFSATSSWHCCRSLLVTLQDSSA